ncbi:sphingomyelin phosphodiesterase [Vibrio aestuarianus]|uniref:sphingomyelin phosphodiesterase n=1 Tax=Vibrio aestuarianus TaxID=28171 RepID=UPI00237D0DD7|nr:sphingomyelin phosphodiesterase [Vibrio aestuarianus]MDE1231618.1 sphingomyelin phosphodiesterase [Vibrio aestuarianus]
MKIINSAMLIGFALVSQASFADTDVYLTNNSDMPMSIHVNHTGTDKLQLGREWQQHIETLAPWETKMVLSFNRWNGVRSGKTYQFETKVTLPQGQTFSLQQKVKGHWYNSSMEYGVQAQDVSLHWQDDRNIHRYQTEELTTQPAELAFKSARTARYDDIHYTITPTKIEAKPDADANAFKVMTYNVWALPVVASHISDRFSVIPEYVKGYDALMLQEVFASGRDAFLRDLAKEYPYQTKMLNKPGVNIYDGGVTIVSRYPIVNQGQYAFPDCSGTDCFADKGINYAEIIKNGKAYHLFATHTAAFDTDTARHYRQRQFKQMRSFAQSLAILPSDTVIYGGDFNVNKRKFADDYQSMLTNLSVTEPSYAGYTESTFDPRINDFAGKPSSGDGNVEYLDYVVVSKEFAQPSEQNLNTVLVPRTTDKRLWQHYNLSDHFPVKAEIR